MRKGFVRLLAVVLGLGAASVSALEISGNLTMDASVTVSQNTEFRIWASAANASAPNNISVVVTVPAGSTSATMVPFTLNPVNTDNDGWEVWFACETFSTPAGCDQVVTKGSYTTTDALSGNTGYSKATMDKLPSDSDTTGLVLTILPGKTVSGQISVPPTTTAAEDISPEILVYPDQTAARGFLFGTIPTIAQNGTSTSFTLQIPNDPSETFDLRYLCTYPPFDYCEPYLLQGYFDRDSPGNASASSSDRDIFAVSNNLSSMNFFLLPAASVSGSITLDAPAPVGGTQFWVFVRDVSVGGTAFYSAVITFAAGQTTKGYYIGITTDTNAEWQLDFNCQLDDTPAGCADYVPVSYYQSSATNNLVFSSDVAETFVGGPSYENLDVTFTGAPTIEGTLALSPGNVAPEDGLAFIVSVRDPVDSAGSSIVYEIPEGENGVDFTIAIDPNPARTWRVSYSCNDAVTPLCSKTDGIGYYDAVSMETVADMNSAEALGGGVSHSNVLLRVASEFSEQLCFPVRAASGTTSMVCL